MFGSKTPKTTTTVMRIEDGAIATTTDRRGNVVLVETLRVVPSTGASSYYTRQEAGRPAAEAVVVDDIEHERIVRRWH